jgi:hypothetical protein
MSNLQYKYECTCGRGRGGVPVISKNQKIKHKCPHWIFAGNIDDSNCNCCLSCTIMCLPVKLIRDNKDSNNLFSWPDENK